jgi:tetratricopeptide (TPR) repeat protein
MVPSNNNVAEGLLTSAHDSAVHDGLRLAVPRYLEAVDALIAEDRREDAADVLAELLAAKEKRRGFFLGKRDQNPLGNQRPAVAKKYAQLVRGRAPTEASLDALNQIAIEFPDDFDVRVANAEALRQSGYLLDALDEYKYCKTLHSTDVELDAKLGELYGQLGRADEAISQTHQALAEYAKAGNDDGVSKLAVRLLEFAPNALEESIAAFASFSPQTLEKHIGDFEAVVAAFAGGNVQDPPRRADLVARIASCYEKLLARDRINQSLWQALSKVDLAVAEEVRQRLDGKVDRPSAAPVVIIDSTPAPPVAREPAPVEAQASAPAPETAPKRPTAAGGLSAFAKRKAMELFANSEYEAASVQLQRVVKMSPDVEALEMLLECYLVLNRHDEAARIGVQLADAELAAGNRPGAIATLTTLSKKIADPAVEQRRVDLMQNK